jgi:hypothetical protein
MTAEKVIRVAQAHAAQIIEHFPTATAKCCDTSMKVYPTSTESWVAVACHLLHVAGRIEEFINQGDIEKAMRWLGFLQGSLWVLGIQTIDQMRDANR